MYMKRKIKVSYHSGKGFSKHLNHYRTKRDKGNINYDLTPQNKIWTCIDGVTDVAEAEKMLYTQMFSEELEMQNKKYKKKGNYGHIRTIDEWLRADRHRAVENILQIGDMNCFIEPDDLWECYKEFVRWRNEKFGNNLTLISSVLHIDESTPHIHERYVWHYTDEQGIKHTGMKKSMEQAGIELPDPDKPEDRYNYRKMTFDAVCREKWQDIVEDMLQQYVDVELDRTIDEERKKHRIGHMGVNNFRAYQGAMNRVLRTASMLKKKEDAMKQREQEILEEKEQLAKEAADIEAAAKQQDADIAALAVEMENIRKRKEELDEQEKTFKQRVKEAAKRRVQAEEKREKVKQELKRYYSDPGYVLGSGD